jgi:hypothetical protein
MRSSALSLGLIAVVGLSAGHAQSRVVVAPSVWTESVETQASARARFALPPALIERVLVDRELNGGATDLTLSHRLWLSQVQVAIACGADERLVDGRPRWVKTGCAGPQLEGALDQRSGGEEVITIAIVAPQVTETDAGYAWSARLRLGLEGRHAYEARLEGAVTIAADGRHRLSVRWEGPLPPR